MTTEITIAVVAIGFAILGHIVTSVFWAGGVNAKLQIVIDNQGNLKTAVDSFRENCFTKTDAAARHARSDKEHDDLWKGVGDIRKELLQGPRREG